MQALQQHITPMQYMCGGRLVLVLVPAMSMYVFSMWLSWFHFINMQRWCKPTFYVRFILVRIVRARCFKDGKPEEVDQRKSCRIVICGLFLLLEVSRNHRMELYRINRHDVYWPIRFWLQVIRPTSLHRPYMRCPPQTTPSAPPAATASFFPISDTNDRILESKAVLVYMDCVLFLPNSLFPIQVYYILHCILLGRNISIV